MRASTRAHGRGSAGDERPPAAASLRYALGAVLAFGALNAFAGGYYGLAGAEGVPREWLRGSPFRDYFIPSLVLFAIVGGAFLVAAIAVFARWRQDGRLAMAAGVIVLVWLAAQVVIIGYVSWMQPATAVGGAVVVALARRLRSSKSPGRGPMRAPIRATGSRDKR